MKAIVYHEYGSPDKPLLQDVEVPVPNDDEILVRVRAASLNWLDWHFLIGTPFLARLMAGLFKLKRTILEIDVAGTVEATGVCSTRNLDMARSIGADHVIDYTEEDFTQGGQRYDLIFDAVAKRPFSGCKRALSPQGTYVTSEFSPVLAVAGFWTAMTGDKKLAPLPSK